MRRLPDRLLRPIARRLHLGLGLTPSQVSWGALWASLAAAVIIALGHVGIGLGVMAFGQVVDGLDGAMAREFGLSSAEGHKLDTIFDRVSETAIFAAFAAAGLVPISSAVLAIVAVLLLTSVCDRSGLDPGVKRFALYFGRWIPYPTLFALIFGVNLAAYVIGLLIIDCQFQLKMDALGGDLDTVASRAVALEVAEKQASRSAAERPALG